MPIPHCLYIAANSPGEIAGWLKPIAASVRQRWPKCQIKVILLPCPFATGAESRVLTENLEDLEIIPASDYLKLFRLSAQEQRNSVLLHLGGDLMYSALLLWRWKIPAWSYQWGRRWWDWAFAGYFIKDEGHYDWLRAHKIPLDKTTVVGDLVVDDVRMSMEAYLARHDGKLPEHHDNLISFLPGSRYIELSNLAPFFLETAKLMLQKDPNLRFQMIISPFIEPYRLAKALTTPPHPALGGLKGRLVGDTLTAEGISIDLIRQNRLPRISSSQLVISIPGTKTAEAASLGVPQLVFVPMNRPEYIPVTGLLGLLDWIPGGRFVKGMLLSSMQRKLDLYVSQPNILAQKDIIPEIINVVTPAGIAETAIQLLNHPKQLAYQKSEFSRLYAPHVGAAQRILGAIEAYEPCQP